MAFVSASDLMTARNFYEQALGLQLTADESPVAFVFDAGGTTLRVTAVPTVARASYAVLGWAVSDIMGEVDELSERGVVFLRFDGFAQDERGIWTAPGGDLVAWFSDPAGNTLSLTELRSPST